MTRAIINLTQHSATPEQINDFVVDLKPEYKKQLAALLTFETLPSQEEINSRVEGVKNILIETGIKVSFDAMIGGAPYLMNPLAKMLIDDFKAVPLYAFTQRVSVEDPTTGVKTSVFKHMGFVPHI